MTFDWFGSQRTPLNSKEVFGHFTKDSLGCRRLCREGRNWSLLLGLGDAEAINPVKKRVINLIYRTVCIRWENVQRFLCCNVPSCYFQVWNVCQWLVCNVRKLLTSIALMKMRGLYLVCEKLIRILARILKDIFPFLCFFCSSFLWKSTDPSQEVTKKSTSNVKPPCPIRKKRHSWFSPQLSLGQSCL